MKKDKVAPLASYPSATTEQRRADVSETLDSLMWNIVDAAEQAVLTDDSTWHGKRNAEMEALAEYVSGELASVQRALDELKGLRVVWDSSIRGAWDTIKELQSELVARTAERDALRGALEKIAEGRGEFSMDPLKHATNVIEDAIATARAALTPPGETK